MAISKRLRYEIFRRDNHACRYCGAKAPDVKLTIDHVVPETLGGADEPSNLVTACADCNSGKSSTSPEASLVEDVAADALRWAAARERALAVLAAERADLEEYVSNFLAYWDEEAPAFANLPNDWDGSIVQFYEAGLPYDELIDAARIAIMAGHVARRQRFSYMCGVVWRKVERLQTMTEELARGEEDA